MDSPAPDAECHSALSVPHILEHIFLYLYTPLYSSKNLLCNVILVCHQWKEVGLDILWRDVDAVHFLGMLPQVRDVDDELVSVIYSSGFKVTNLSSCRVSRCS